jgi:hypothetical protein
MLGQIEALRSPKPVGLGWSELDHWRNAVSRPFALLVGQVAGCNQLLGWGRASRHDYAIKVVEDKADELIMLALTALARGPVSRTHQEC